MSDPSLRATILLPSFEQVRDDKRAFAEATRIIHTNTNPFNAATLVQFHDRQAVVQTPPALPLSQAEMDAIYDLPYTRRPHPSYTEPIPAHEMIKDSVTIMRGCFGGCTFCSITAHQGRIIQSRSQESVLKEVEKLAADPEFKGVISRHRRGDREHVHDALLAAGGGSEVQAALVRSPHHLQAARHRSRPAHRVDAARSANVDGIRKVLVSSGIRMDLAQLSPEYVRELADHHTGGRLKVAPEHTSPKVLELMKKPSIDNFGTFAEQFQEGSRRRGQAEAADRAVLHRQPSRLRSLHEMIDLALYLKRNGYRPDQVQDFIPAPFDIATCMYYTGIDPFTKQAGYSREGTCATARCSGP